MRRGFGRSCAVRRRRCRASAARGVFMWRGPTACTPRRLLRAWSSPVSGAYRVHPNGFLEKAQL
ncbi:MAG: hypothetical protein ACLU3I_10600 [Acutalibacteraceae bacterium]